MLIKTPICGRKVLRDGVMHALVDENHDPIGVGEGEGKEPVGCDGAVDLIRDGQDELIKADLALKVHLLAGGDLV